MREVGENKAAILAYFDAEEKAAREKSEREYATFQAIPGVKEIQESRRQYADWKVEFDRMMETGSSQMPYVEHKSPDEMAALEEQYPLAVFALEAQHRACYTANLRLGSIWAKTYQDILDGQDVAAVKADHDARMDEYDRTVILD